MAEKQMMVCPDRACKCAGTSITTHCIQHVRHISCEVGCNLDGHRGDIRCVPVPAPEPEAKCCDGKRYTGSEKEFAHACCTPAPEPIPCSDEACTKFGDCDGKCPAPVPSTVGPDGVLESDQLLSWLRKHLPSAEPNDGNRKQLFVEGMRYGAKAQRAADLADPDRLSKAEVRKVLDRFDADYKALMNNNDVPPAIREIQGIRLGTVRLIRASLGLDKEGK